MKRFWTIVAGSFVGFWLWLLIFSVIAVVCCVAFVGNLSSIGSSTKSVEKNSVLLLDLGIEVGERDRTSYDMRSVLPSNSPSVVGLDKILKGIELAAQNSNVNGICINANGISAGFASRQEIRQALIEFKKRGKFIYAYGDDYTQSDYYIASVADSIFLNPVGAVDVHGLSAMSPFYKGLLDKLGIEIQVLRVGTFKSAVEPYTLKKMSDANRLQQEHYLGRMWDKVSTDIAEARGMTARRINEIADGMVICNKAEWTVDAGLVDGLCYDFEMIDRLRRLTKVDGNDDPLLVSIDDVVSAEPEDWHGSDRIAIIYAEGQIDGPGEDDIDSEALVGDIVEAARDEYVRGVVIRVNSPGGSAYGSEQIWKALEEVKRNGKPLAASMGDYAASGGYYIACGADRIFAEPVTITGSIGIFGIIPCFENLAEQKLGITFDYVSTNKNGSITMMRRLTTEQLASMQKMIEDGYDLFTQRCADGRHMALDSLKMIAEGRVWDGVSAIELGLVDEHGSLGDAVEWVAKEAGLVDYGIDKYPAVEDKLFKYISRYVDTEIEGRMKDSMGELYQYYEVVERLSRLDPVQCLMEPVEIE